MEKPQLTDNQNGKTRLPHGDGLYVKGLINGVNVLYTVKIGAACSVISDRVYNSIPEEMRPLLTRCTELTDATDQSTSQKGSAVFSIELGSGPKFNHIIMVANIEDDGLLGQDLLRHCKGIMLYNKDTLSLIGVSLRKSVHLQEKEPKQVQSS